MATNRFSQSARNSQPPPHVSNPISTQPSWKWACTSLEELELSLMCLKSTAKGKGFMKVVFDQLAELVHLKKLVLKWRCHPSTGNGTQSEVTASASSSSLSSSSPWEPTLNLGLDSGLKSLVTLQKLRILDLRLVDSTNLTSLDVWWMCKHWTSLRSIRGKLTIDVEEGAIISKLVNNLFPHVKLDQNVGGILPQDAPPP